MAHIMMQAAEFPSVADAASALEKMQVLYDAYIDFEINDPDAYTPDRIPPPLAEFGERHGVAYPNDETSQFLLKGSFEEMTGLTQIERMVFFWGGGFELGGEWLRVILTKWGAVHADEYCNLTVRCADPDALIEEFVTYLEGEEYEDQFSLEPANISWALHSLTLQGPHLSRVISFDDSGVQDWAFVTLLSQLEGRDLRFSK